MEDILQKVDGVLRQFVQTTMNRYLTALAASLCLTAAFQSGAAAQGYETPQVVVSTEKVRYGGKVFYSHIVKERQTLYSISKAYNVSLQEIYEANPTLHLDTEGLKKDQIILIPVKDVELQSVERNNATAQKAETETQAESSAAQVKEGDEYFFHRVKWFEDLSSIARKYMVSKESIMNINGMDSDKIRRKDMLKIPTHPEKWEGRSAAPSTSSNEQENDKKGSSQVAEKTDDGQGFFDRIFTRKRSASISVLLPFNASKKADTQMMDFYSGALLAAEDLGKSGNELELNVYDIAGGAMPVTEERFSSSDFVIGPVANSDIIRTVNASKGKSWIVSPLDPRAEALADTIPNIIQAPSPTSAQTKDMVKWVETDLRDNDRVILVTQKGVAANNYSAEVIREVNNYGLKHTDISFNILEGRQVMGKIASQMTGEGTNRVIIASDSKAFVIEVVRLLYLISSQKKDIVLYGTSKLRTFDEIDIEQLHSLNLHACVSYYVDYDSKEVQDFLMRYRAIYNTEPSRSAFQGYDMLKFFTGLSYDYGKNMDKACGTKRHGLQSDLKLVKTKRGGYVNEATRRVVYNPDYTVSLVK